MSLVRTHALFLVNDLFVDLRSVDKLEQMLGSYGPHPKGEAYTKNFDPEESPSGALARMGSFNVRSRVVDDDGGVYAGMSPDSRKYAQDLTCRMGRLGVVFQARERVVNNWRFFFLLSSCIILGHPLA